MGKLKKASSSKEHRTDRVGSQKFGKGERIDREGEKMKSITDPGGLACQYDLIGCPLNIQKCVSINKAAKASQVLNNFKMFQIVRLIFSNEQD